jgi:hypothetical protein
MLRLAARQMKTPSATSPPLCVVGAGGFVGDRGEGGGATIGPLRGAVQCLPHAARAARLHRRCAGAGAEHACSARRPRGDVRFRLRLRGCAAAPAAARRSAARRCCEVYRQKRASQALQSGRYALGTCRVGRNCTGLPAAQCRSRPPQPVRTPRLLYSARCIVVPRLDPSASLFAMALRRAVGPLCRALAAGAREAPVVAGCAAAQRCFASGGASAGTQDETVGACARSRRAEAAPRRARQQLCTRPTSRRLTRVLRSLPRPQTRAVRRLAFAATASPRASTAPST